MIITLKQKESSRTAQGIWDIWLFYVFTDIFIEGCWLNKEAREGYNGRGTAHAKIVMSSKNSSSFVTHSYLPFLQALSAVGSYASISVNI